jgi:hypothetical protein
MRIVPSQIVAVTLRGTKHARRQGVQTLLHGTELLIGSNGRLLQIWEPPHLSRATMTGMSNF